MSEEKTITIKKGDLWKYSTFLLLAIVVVFLIVSYGGIGKTGSVIAPSEPQQAQGNLVPVQILDSPAMGDPNAPVTIVEFVDYRCGFCGRHALETTPLIKRDYIDEGLVYYVVKEFAVLGPASVTAAEAVHCARAQGGDDAYFKMHDEMFSNSACASDPAGCAAGLGYNIASCLASGEYSSVVQRDTSDAQRAGGTGTPHFVILSTEDSTGVPIRGAQPYSVFAQTIESLL